MEGEVDMNILVGMVLLLAPALPVHAALVFPDCCSDSPADNLPVEKVRETAPPARCQAVALNQLGARQYAAGNYPDSDPVTLSGTLFNLAAVERMESRLAESETLYTRAIAIREAAAGSESPAL